MRVLPSLETEPRDLRNVDIKIGPLIQNLIGPNLTHARSLGGPYTMIPSITLGSLTMISIVWIVSMRGPYNILDQSLNNPSLLDQAI